jgi:hypothetical protein
MQTLKDSPTAFCPPGNSDEYLDLIGSALVILQMVFHLLCIVQIFLICMLLLLLLLFTTISFNTHAVQIRYFKCMEY